MDLRIISISAFLLLTHTSFGQNEDDGVAKKRSLFMIAIGHTVVGQGINDQGKRSWLSLPSWMIDYDYSLSVGGEFSTIGNYFVTLLGFEYEFELPGEWKLAPTITYDIKWNAYDSFNVGLGIGKRF